MLLVTSVQASVDGDSEIVGDRPEASAQAATSTCVHVDTWGSLERLWKDTRVPQAKIGWSQPVSSPKH